MGQHFSTPTYLSNGNENIYLRKSMDKSIPSNFTHESPKWEASIKRRMINKLWFYGIITQQ